MARLGDPKESSRGVFFFFFVDRLLTSLSFNDLLKGVDALGNVKSGCKDDRIKLVLHIVHSRDPSGSDTFNARGVEVDKLLVERWKVGVGKCRPLAADVVVWGQPGGQFVILHLRLNETFYRCLQLVRCFAFGVDDF